MAIETHQDRVEPAGTGPPLGGPGGVLRPWWLRPGVHVGVIGATVGYILGHLLGNFLSSAYAQNALSDSNDVPIVLGSFGQYFGPLLIGSKRVAFPRLEALGFWLTPAAYVILLSAVLFGGFPTGWTGYEPLATQATQGEDAYFFAFGLMGISMILAGFNMIVTIINYRAPGMRWSRLPMFVWSMFTVSFLQVLAVPVLVGACYMALMDRTFQTAFFTNQLGGSSFLYEDLFWFFGHPEVYILALPGFGVISEVVAVFCPKPLFGYRVAAAGMIGVGLLSFFVWQHHLFDSGINPAMRPLF